MPNWACANYVASGDRVELEELVRTLNTMPNLLPDTPSGFGRYCDSSGMDVPPVLL